MPLPDLGDLPDNQIVLHFETNDVIEMKQISAVFSELAQLAYEHPAIGWDATVVLLRLKSGSPTTVWIEILNACGAAAGIGQFGLGVAALLQTNQQRKLCRRTAELMADNNVTDFSIVIREDGSTNQRITMTRSQIPAVEAIEAERANIRKLSAPSSGAEMLGRIVTTHGGRFAVFRTGHDEYRVVKPEDLYQQVPIGEDIIVVADRNGDDISITDWRMASDDNIDWENIAGLPGVQAEKLRALETRAEWPESFDQTEDEQRMRAILYEQDDDFVSFENTQTFVGKFADIEDYRIFRTQEGREFRIFRPYREKAERNVVVRAQVLRDDIGARDWLNIMDVFHIS